MRVIRSAAYEGLFLFPQSAAMDLKGSVEFLKDVLGKHGAEIIALKKWGDRPLAYPINKQKRGVYILAYFNAPTDKLQGIDRSFNLSEQLLRHLVTKADHLTIEEMKATEGQADLTIEANLRAQEPAPAVTTPAAAAPVPAPVG